MSARKHAISLDGDLAKEVQRAAKVESRGNVSAWLAEAARSRLRHLAAKQALKIYEDENLIENAAAMGRYVDQQIAKLQSKHPSIGDWRNTGLLGCLELVRNRRTKEPMAPYNAKPEEMAVMNQVAARLKQLGMYTFVRWNYIFIAPPLSITREQIDEGLAMISDALTIADAHVTE